mmetsp:Transcript_3226/g.8721  ORF Transcript_3226/g.8721 Transcript_3226/m.8721 type:complete len:211 (-) Transcript_3226:1438-2070(-)
MDYDRASEASLLVLVLKVKTLRQLKVELDGGALVGTTNGVRDVNVDFGAVESAVPRVQLPFALAETRIENLFQRFLCLIPHFGVTKIIFRARGKFQGKLVPKDAVDVLHKVDLVVEFLLHLLVGAENVAVVLLEPPHARKTGERATKFVTVQYTKVGKAERELPVGPRTMSKHQAVTRAVHGFQAVDLTLHVEGKHVFLVHLPVTRSLPQ